MSFESMFDKIQDTFDGSKILRVVMKVSGPLLAMVLLSLIAFISYTFLTWLLPYYSPPMTLFYNATLILWFTYFLVVTVNPGNPPMSLNQQDIESASMHPAKTCKKCKTVKPPRSHHCAICQRCVLVMDHHCPWVMNCVGFYNHKYFLLFLFHLWIGCLYITIVSTPFIRRMFIDKKVLLNILLTYIFTAVFSFVLIFFFGFNFYLVLTAQTQVEFYENSISKQRAKRSGEHFKHPFDLGYKKNFQHFFGVTGSKWWMFWVPSSNPPIGDGINFETSSQREQISEVV